MLLFRIGGLFSETFADSFICVRLEGQVNPTGYVGSRHANNQKVLGGCRGRYIRNSAVSLCSAHRFPSVGHRLELKQKSGVYQRFLITFLLFCAGGPKPSQLVIGSNSENPLSAHWHDACSSVTGKPINNGIGYGPLKNTVPMASFSPVN